MPLSFVSSIWRHVSKPLESLRRIAVIFYWNEPSLEVYWNSETATVVLKVAGNLCPPIRTTVIHDGSEHIQKLLEENTEYIVDSDDGVYYLERPGDPFWLEGDDNVNIIDAIAPLMPTTERQKITIDNVYVNGRAATEQEDIPKSTWHDLASYHAVAFTICGV